MFAKPGPGGGLCGGGTLGHVMGCECVLRLHNPFPSRVGSSAVPFMDLCVRSGLFYARVLRLNWGGGGGSSEVRLGLFPS